MAAATGRRRRHGSHDHEGEHENEERWLVSYADMMTLLMCLFMVMFSISSVNISKFQDLQRSLQAAFSGKAVGGGHALLQTGNTSRTERAAATPPLPAITPQKEVMANGRNTSAAAEMRAAEAEQQEFETLKRRVDAAAAQLGLRHQVQATIRDRGLVVRLLTDGIFFASGSAQLKAGARPILRRLAQVVAAEGRHPVVVEGYTDAQPIRNSVYPSNWELSGARASSVVREFAADGVDPIRMSLSGYGQQHPVASNATAAGRSRNRRVEIVMTRLHASPTSP